VKGDGDLAAAERKRQKMWKSGKHTALSTAAPSYDLSNAALLWPNNTPPAGLGDHPVALIRIADAQDFCEWLNSRYPTLGRFRLPSVNEWLLAAYGANRRYPWGNEWSFDIPCVSTSEQARRTTTEPVKAHAKDKTPEGIYGLWGNVAEYVGSGLSGRSWGDTRWMGPSFKRYPMKEEGGMFPFTPRNEWWGYVHNAESRMEDLGFRVLLELPAAHNKNGAENGSKPIRSEPLQQVQPPLIIQPPSTYSGFVHSSIFKRVELSPDKPEGDGLRLVSISDGIVIVRLENGHLISAPAQKGAIFRQASHGYSGGTGIPLEEFDLDAGRVVLKFETRVYRATPTD